MKRQKMALVILGFSLAFSAAASAQRTDDLTVMPLTIVIPSQVDKVEKSQMMKHYLQWLANRRFEKWKDTYESLKTPEQIAEYQKRLREKFIEAIGGFPQRTPLNARVVGVVDRDGYRIEKVIFESQPDHHITALLFLPDSPKYSPPYPAVLLVCGHSSPGKAAYQPGGALMALNGMAALVFDPIDQGERQQLLYDKDEEPLRATQGHNMVGVGCILLGRNTARFEIWDGMRAIDYLQSRPEINPELIGCAGNSGGGTQTSYLMALDDRILAAAPSCYITSFERLLLTIGPQDAEQNIYGQLAFGMDHADYILMRAPKPTLICCATLDFFDIRGTWDTFRYAKRLYSRMGFSERVELIENDAPHGWDRPIREATARWMMRWLLGKDEAVTEPDIELLSEQEIQCTPQGQVLLLEGEKTTYDLNRDYEKQLAQRRKKMWATTDQHKMLDEVRKTAGIRPLTELPELKVQKLDFAERDGYKIRKMLFIPAFGIYLPALMFIPDNPSKANPVLFVSERGKRKHSLPGGSIEELVKTGQVVLAVDLRGTGETFQTAGYYKGLFGLDGKDVCTAYLLGRSYVGMRAEDVLMCANYLRQQQGTQVELIAVGNVGIPALHAAVLEQDLFSSVKLVCSLISWSSLIELGRSYNQLVNAVHGALLTYDLDNLAAVLADKLTIEQPLNALGEPIKSSQR